MAEYRVRNLVNADGIQRNVALRVEGSRIASIDPITVESDGSVEAPYEYAVPGFIDCHTHGALGRDLMDRDDEAFRQIAGFHLANGTTSFLGSTLTTSLDEIEEFLAWIRPRMARNGTRAAEGRESTLAGVHLEGPWISRRNLGAQNERHVIEPDGESFRIVRENADIVSMVTFSYHSQGAREFLDLLVELGIVPAAGHDETTDEEAVEGFARGLTHLTHIYCNSSSFQRRNGYKHLGSLEMALITPGVSVEVIADDRHITKYFWEFIIHNKSVEDIILVSDSTRGAGLPEDPERVYKLGELNMVIDDGVAWLSDRTVFAGSTSTMLRMFRMVVQRWGMSMPDAVRMTSANQARRFGMTELDGGIAVGRRADFLLLDADLSVQAIVKSGVEAAVAGESGGVNGHRPTDGVL